MQDFIYHNKTELLFGKDKELLIGARLKEFGAKNVLLCYGQGSVIKSGLLGKIKELLTVEGIDYCDYGGVCANPSKSHALSGIDFARANNADFVLAVGGGSVIDEAKCIAVGAVNDDIWKYFEGKDDVSKLTRALPMGAVLTLPAAGSEGSMNSVIRDEKTGRKYALGTELIRPRYAFVNPEHCFTLPKYQIANGISDILAHLMERYFSPQDNVSVTDGLLTGAMQAMLRIAPKVYGDNTNYDYCLELCLLGTLAHNGMLNMGRGIQDWATHNMENAFLSGVNNIAHGAGLAILFPAWLKYVSKTKPAKILQFAIEVMGAQGCTDEEIIGNGIAALVAFYKSLGLPVTLGDAGLSVCNVKKLVKQVYGSGTALGGYGRLSPCDIEKVIELAG
jgi:hypothetical protein